RTPLTSLRMAAEMMRRHGAALHPELKSLVETVHEDVLRLEDVGRRLLDASRSRAMSIALARDPVNVREVVERVGALFTAQARERGITLETSVPPDMTIPGDATKLAWAVSNLVANALRYTPAGGRITLGADGDHAVVRLAVSDTGAGIPPE